MPGRPILLHMVGQGPAVFAAGAGRVGCYIFFHLVYPIFLFSSVGRRRDILKYYGLGRYHPSVVVSY